MDSNIENGDRVTQEGEGVGLDERLKWAMPSVQQDDSLEKFWRLFFEKFVPIAKAELQNTSGTEAD